MNYKNFILKIFLVLGSVFYCYLALLPKHADFWALNMVGAYVASGHLDVYKYGAYSLAMHPPAFYYLQGLWLWIGSFFSIYDLKISPLSINPLFQGYAMIPYLIALFTAVIITYYTSNNKWLSFIWFGTFSFISIIVMGQTDIFCALFIYVSLLLYLHSLKSDNFRFFIFLSFFILGLSISFKTYGGLLFPIYFLISFFMFKSRNITISKVFFSSIVNILGFVLGFIIFSFNNLGQILQISLNGESNWLFNLQISPIGLPYHIISIWLFGYIILIYWLIKKLMFNHFILRNYEIYVIFFSFSAFAWFFAMVYTHPQWWIIFVPTIILVCDKLNNALNLPFLILYHVCGLIPFVLPT